MMGFSSGLIWKPLSTSHCVSAFGFVDLSCTVAYGPTFSCFSTVTSPPALPLFGDAAERSAESRPLEHSAGRPGQLTGGGLMVVAVTHFAQKRGSKARNSTAPIWTLQKSTE